MSALVPHTIAAIRRIHDDLAGRVPDLTDEQLAGPSGSAEWTVAQVLSHLGSGAEIGRASYVAALEGAEPPGPGLNNAVWARWNAMNPREQATEFVASDAALVSLLEGLTAEQRDSLKITIGFLPHALPLESVAGMRLSEAALHSWDVRVGADPDATVDAEAAEALLDHYSGGMGFLLGMVGKADQLPGPAVVAIGDTGLAIDIADGVRLTRDAGAPTATFTGQVEAVIRLLAGRLGPTHTPDTVAVTGNVVLADLRRVFPGY